MSGVICRFGDFCSAEVVIMCNKHVFVQVYQRLMKLISQTAREPVFWYSCVSASVHLFPLSLPDTSASTFLLPPRAIEKLTGHQFDDYSFKVSYIMDTDAAPPVQAPRTRRGGRTSRDQGSSQPGPSGGYGSPRPRQHDFPLRMLVPTQFVGAIIGKEGNTIKDVTKQTQSK